MLIMPLLNTLFVEDQLLEPVTALPSFALNTDYFRSLVNFLIYRVFGTDYSKMDVLIFLSVFIILMSFLSNLFRYLGQRVMETMRVRSLQRLRNRVYDNVMGLHVGYFNNERKGDIISKISSDVQVVQFCITNTLLVAFRDPFMIVGFLIALVMISWKPDDFFGDFPAGRGAGDRFDRQAAAQVGYGCAGTFCRYGQPDGRIADRDQNPQRVQCDRLYPQ